MSENDENSENDVDLELYFDFLSQPSRALYILLHASEQQFKERQVNLLGGEHLGEDYQQNVNRFQKVPAIVEGNFKLAESVAILRYLAASERLADHFYPQDIQKRARVDEFLSWQHNGIRTSCSLYFRFVWVQAKMTGASAEASKVAKYKRMMEHDLKTLQDIWLKDTKFVAGNELTAADVFGACEVEQIRTTGYEVSLKYPKVAQWIERVREALQPHYDVAHRTVCKYEIETKAKL